MDVALLANVLHESSDRAGLLREIARIMHPTGMLGVVEWRKDSGEMGPPQDERLAAEEVQAALQASGFHNVDRFEVGPYHYGIRARK
ncbi:MAG: class I SAM-dependent methyltransferase [Chloroflexi bacterium]|nr:class I SAM-dependent methyltransferase [Chloroflexota bacterium]